jgi:hypothetical protein
MIGLRDPTRSAGLRRQGRAVVTRKVHELHQDLRYNLQDNDLIGLRAKVPVAFSMFVESSGNRLNRSDAMLNHVVEQTLENPPDWLSGVIYRAVARGLELVGQELKVESERLDYTDVARFHGTAATIEVHGIAGETHRRVMRHVGHALEKEASPEVLMREVRATLQRITKQRLNLLVNTAVVRAVNGGKLFAYREYGINQVGIDPEWLPWHMHTHDSVVLHDRETRKAKVRRRKQENKERRAERFTASRAKRLSARTQQRREAVERRLEEALAERGVQVLTAGDDKVCENCLAIAENGPYDLDAARGLIPNHPNCRCAFIPYGDKRYAPIVEQDEDEWF